MVLDHWECLRRGDCLNSHGIRPSEIADVVRDNIRATGCGRQLQNEIIVRIGKERPPSVKYLLMPGQFTEHIDHNLDLRNSKSRNEPGAQYHRLILDGEGNRDRNLQLPGADRSQYLVARATAGTKT